MFTRSRCLLLTHKEDRGNMTITENFPKWLSGGYQLPVSQRQSADSPCSIFFCTRYITAIGNAGFNSLLY